MQESLPNELLIRIFGYVEAADYASAIRMSSWSYHRDLNIRSRGWAMRRVSFDVHTCRLVCRKWNILVLPRVYSQVTIQPTRWDSFMNLLAALPTTHMALAVETVALNQFPAASLSDHLQALLPILSSLKEVKIFRPTRLDQVNNAASTPMTGTIKQLFPTLEKFTVCDATLDDGALVQLVRCVQLFSHIHCFYMSDVSFVGDIERGSAVATSPRATTQIGYLDADSTIPLIARNILFQANCAPLPSKLSVRLAYNPRWMLSLTDLLSLYATTQFASQNQLADLTLTVEPLGYYSPILQVDVDTDCNALTKLCDVLRDVTRSLKRMKLELHVYDGDHITPRKLDLLLRLIGTLPLSLVHLTLDVTFFPDQLWQALALTCRRLESLKVVEIAVDRRRMGRIAKIGVHPAVKWLDDDGILQFYEV